MFMFPTWLSSSKSVAMRRRLHSNVPNEQCAEYVILRFPTRLSSRKGVAIRRTLHSNVPNEDVQQDKV